MTKSDLIHQLADKVGLSIRQAESIVNTLLDKMTDALAEGREIQIRGFGSFSIKGYDGYEGRNPKTGEVVKVKPKKAPVFKVGKDLREKVNNS